MNRSPSASRRFLLISLGSWVVKRGLRHVLDESLPLFLLRRRPQAVYVHAQHGPTLSLRRRRRISGPIMDRIDIHLDVRRVPFEKLAALEGGEPSKVIRARVEAASNVQEARFADLGKTNMLVNGDMGGPLVGLACAALEQRRIKR